MNKDRIEKALRMLGCVPVDRCTILGREVFIGDGYSSAPHHTLVKHGALSEGMFPEGCYTTWWFAIKGEDKLDIGLPLFFEPLHDIEGISLNYRQKARINAAKFAAEYFLSKRDEQRKNSYVSHQSV